MTMDDGYQAELGSDVYNVITRAKAWMRVKGISMSQITDRGVTAAELRRFQDLGDQHLMEHMELIQRLSHALDCPTDYLLTGAMPTNMPWARRVRLQAWQLLEEFQKRGRYPESIMKPFRHFVVQELEVYLTAPQAHRFESKIPRNLNDVVARFQEWKNRH